MVVVLIASVVSLAAGCINPVRTGYPPLVPCSADAGCPLPYVCNSDGGGCEILSCKSDADCAIDAGLTCQELTASGTGFGQCLDGG
jgi:hypothetical protein